MSERVTTARIELREAIKGCTSLEAVRLANAIEDMIDARVAAIIAVTTTPIDGASRAYVIVGVDGSVRWPDGTPVKVEQAS